MSLIDGQCENTGPRPLALFLTVLLSVGTWGCSDRDPLIGVTLYPVKGKVTLPDGQTMAGLKVNFWGPTTDSATTGSDGTFAFTGKKEGLPAGDYKVSLEIAYTAKASKNTKLPFPSRYLDEDSSRLTAKVTADGPNDYDFKLTTDNAGADRSRGSGDGRGKVRN
jgi:Carboxypeptidase regulatory-like domain